MWVCRRLVNPTPDSYTPWQSDLPAVLSSLHSNSWFMLVRPWVLNIMINLGSCLWKNPHRCFSSLPQSPGLVDPSTQLSGLICPWHSYLECAFPQNSALSLHFRLSYMGHATPFNSFSRICCPFCTVLWASSCLHFLCSPGFLSYHSCLLQPLGSDAH